MLWLRTYNGYNLYENKSIYPVRTTDYSGAAQKVSISDLKNVIYDSIVSLLLKDARSEWGHATSIAGIREFNSKYFGIGIGLEDESEKNIISSVFIHYIGIHDNQILDATKFDTSANLEVRDIAKELTTARQDLSKAQAAVDNAKKEHDSATSVLSSAQIAYNNALSTRQTTETQLTTLRSTSLATPAATTALTQANTALDNANKKLEEAEEAVELLSADVKEKQEHLNSAKEELVSAQKLLTDALDVLLTEKDKLTVLESVLSDKEAHHQKALTKVDDAINTLISTQLYLNKLQNAEANLEELIDKLENLKPVYAELLSKQESEFEKLDNLRLIANKLKEIYDDLLSRYQAQQSLLDEETDKKKEGVVNDVVKVPLTFSGLGKMSQDATTEPSTFSRVAKRQLPTTSEDSSQLLVLFGLGLIGLIGWKGRRRKA